ncbi:MAG TPA: ACT domain-containing protein [Thermoanaerobaculia bacterium]|nr:ACT domain-containing protein [Thermoanaerobaculia bacterium]
MTATFDLRVLPGRFAVCRLPPGSAVAALTGGALSAVVQTPKETSVVLAEENVPTGRLSRSMQVERDFRALEVAGPLDFALVGVLASLTAALAAAAVSVFALSTFDTDYLLVRETDLERAVEALRGEGHRVEG